MNLVFNFDKATSKYEEIDTILIFKTNFKKQLTLLNNINNKFFFSYFSYKYQFFSLHSCKKICINT